MAFFEIEGETQYWKMAIALDWYSHWDKIRFKYQKTEFGQAIHEYKYYRNVSIERRQTIVKMCVDEIERVLQLNLALEKSTFNSCIAAMPNSKNLYSLPVEIATNLSERFKWIRDDSRFLIKNRNLEKLMNIRRDKRPEYISGAYSINKNYQAPIPKGILLLDDVYETGSTMRETCKTLDQVFPNVPRYVLAITRRRVPKVWIMGS